MSEWVEKHIGDIAFVTMGQSPKSESYNNVGDGLPFLQGNRTFGKKYPTFDTYTTSPGKSAEANDVIMSVRAPVGDLNITPVKMCLGRGVCSLKPKNGNYKFLYYLLYCNVPIILSRSNGTVYDSINRADIEKMRIVVPKEEKQQTRIAEILSTYDDEIENNNRRIALLEKAARELYREWFVRFRFPGHESSKFVNGLPVGWEVVPLEELVNITSSKRIYLSDYVNDGIPFYRSKEVIQLVNGEAITEPLYISVEKYNGLIDKSGAPCENDILIMSVGTIGVSFLVDKRVFYFKDGNLTWLQSGVTPELGLYIYLWLNSEIGQSALLSSTIGTSQSALTIENLKRIKIMKPSDNIFSDFYSMTMSHIALKRTLQIQTQSQNLARQRDLLLPRLMNEKLEV